MKHVQIKDETRQLIRARANEAKHGVFKDTSFRYDNAWWIEVDDEVYSKLEQLRAPNESFDEVICQVLTHGNA